jgi:hypothetical protein
MQGIATETEKQREDGGKNKGTDATSSITKQCGTKQETRGDMCYTIRNKDCQRIWEWKERKSKVGQNNETTVKHSTNIHVPLAWLVSRPSVECVRYSAERLGEFISQIRKGVEGSSRDLL